MSWMRYGCVLDRYWMHLDALRMHFKTSDAIGCIGYNIACGCAPDAKASSAGPYSLARVSESGVDEYERKYA